MGEKMNEVSEDCRKQLREKDDQIKRLQTLLNNKDDHMRKLTNRITSSSDFEGKVKKFFGENEDFHKKRVAELTKSNGELMARLEESEKRRMESMLEESDTSKMKEALVNLTTVSDNIQQKTDMVWAVVNSLEAGGDLTRNADMGKNETGGGMVSSTVGLLHNKVDKMIRLMVETSENQKKMNKVLQDLLKVGFVKQANVENGEEEEKKKRKKDKDRDRSCKSNGNQNTLVATN